MQNKPNTTMKRRNSLKDTAATAALTGTSGLMASDKISDTDRLFANLMNRLKFIIVALAIITILGGCTNTRYMTDPMSRGRQRDMRKHRIGNNVGEVFINFFSFILSEAIDSEYEMTKSERAFKKISIVNESNDSLFVNMVTDIVWKESGYCDIMGIALPPKAKQRMLVPYPAAYNVYFKTPFTEEENLEIRTDSKHRRFILRPGMTDWLKENGN